MALVLASEDVRQCVTMVDAIGAIEDMCREQAAGNAVFADRVNLPLPNGWIRLMPGALISSGVMGYKEFHLTRMTDAHSPAARVRYAFHLLDYRSGELLAMMDANYLTAIRTGAASGVAVKYLAPRDSAVLGVIGSGAEARSHVEAVAAVRSIKRATVFSRQPERRERFARDMAERLGIEITPVGRPEQTIEEADILIVATNTAGTGPALLGQWLPASPRKGLHINSVGSTLPNQREIDPGVWSLADRIVLDTRRLLHESGDGIVAMEARVVDEAAVAELHEVVTGRAPARTRGDEITLYKSIGTGLQDVAVAYRAYRQALARGLGRQFEEYQSMKGVEPN